MARSLCGAFLPDRQVKEVLDCKQFDGVDDADDDDDDDNDDDDFASRHRDILIRMMYAGIPLTADELATMSQDTPAAIEVSDEKHSEPISRR